MDKLNYENTDSVFEYQSKNHIKILIAEIHQITNKIPIRSNYLFIIWHILYNYIDTKLDITFF